MSNHQVKLWTVFWHFFAISSNYKATLRIWIFFLNFITFDQVLSFYSQLFISSKNTTFQILIFNVYRHQNTFTLFLTILVIKNKFWDHILIELIHISLYRSGLKFIFWPPEIWFIVLLYFIGPKIAKHGHLWSWS